MSTLLRYNSVEIRNCQTTRFEQTAQLDESNTDLLYHNFRVRVEGVVSDNPAAHVRVTTASTQPNTTAQMAAIHRELMHPRRDFWYGFEVRAGGQAQGTRTLLQATANANTQNPGDLDCNNGPKPIDVSINHIAGLKVYRISFEIEVAIRKCNASQYTLPSYGAKRLPQVLNNRWTLTDAKDADFFTTRTWEGILRVAHASTYPHAFRAMVAPPLQKDYQRISQRFAQSADGLTLRYQITDRQREAAPPQPAVNWEATQSTSFQTGLTFPVSAIRVRVQGAPGGDKQALLGAAANVVFQRLTGLRGQLTGQAGTQTLLRSATLTDVLHEPIVEINAEVQHFKSGPQMLNLALSSVGTPLQIPGYDASRWPTPALYDSNTPAGTFATYWQNPCDSQHGIVGEHSLQAAAIEGEPSDTEPETPEVYQLEGPIPEDSLPAYSQEHTGDNPYTYMRVENEYDTDSGVMQIPYASSNIRGKTETVAIIPRHSGVATRRLILHGERAGDWPVMPTPLKMFTDSNGIKYHLLSSRILPDAPEILPDGHNFLHIQRVEYLYAMSRPIQQNEKIQTHTSPLDVRPGQANEINTRVAFDPDGPT